MTKTKPACDNLDLKHIDKASAVSEISSRVNIYHV